jgi:uncharacterized protein (TIGR02466 family)
MRTQIDYLFPTPVGIFDLENNVICQDYSNLVLDMYQKERVVGKTNAATTLDNLHTLDNFKNLLDLINPVVAKFSEETLGLEPESLLMTAMWSNIRYSGSKHHIHQHPNSFVSGVIYLSVPNDAIEPGNLFFVDPRPAKNMMHGIYTNQSPISDRTWWYTPKTGIMILFPSWLEHGTDEYYSNSSVPRISLSFNFILNKFISH